MLKFTHDNSWCEYVSPDSEAGSEIRVMYANNEGLEQQVGAVNEDIYPEIAEQINLKQLYAHNNLLSSEGARRIVACLRRVDV